MHNYTQEEYRQRGLDRVQEWKDTIPGYREQVLERLIEREMYAEASRYNSDLDYQERLKKAANLEEHSTAVKCICSKIKKLFGNNF